MLRPMESGDIHIYIQDSNGNRIKQWNKEFTSRGFISKELQLSDQPVLGEWTIFVEVLEQKFNKSFTVSEYVLPTFDVELLLPAYATYNSTDIVATIKAIYTYGKPVKGEVTLTVREIEYYYQNGLRYALPLNHFQTKISIDGIVVIPVNIVRDLNIETSFFDTEYEFVALVEEGLTGRKYNKSSTIIIYGNEVKVELIKTSNTFKPGLRYTAFLKVAYQDDKPVKDNGPQLKLLYGYGYKLNQTVMLTPVKGLIKIEVYPPRTEKINELGMRAEYKGLKYYLGSVECAQSPSNNFIQVIKDEQTNAKVDQEISFEVNATEPLNRMVYTVMGRGDIVLSRTVNVLNTYSFKFNILVTHKMAPKARIVTYYVRKNQEIVADALIFDVDGVFKTKVTVETNIKNTKPGTMVDVRVQTKPNAYVGVLGIDQSVLLLKTGNDITQQDDICLTVLAYRTHKVANNKPVPITVYDYYNRAKMAHIFYEPTFTLFCEICSDNGSGCSDKCKKNNNGSTNLFGEESDHKVNS